MRNVIDILTDLKVINEKIAEAPDDSQSDEAALEILKRQRLDLERELKNSKPGYLKP